MHWRGQTRDDPYPMPAQSLRDIPVPDVRERAAVSFIVVFLSLVFAIPMILAGIMMHFR